MDGFTKDAYVNNAKVPEIMPEHKQLNDLQQQFLQAKVEFDAACQDSARAINRRERAATELQKLAEVLHQAIQSAGYA